MLLTVVLNLLVGTVEIKILIEINFYFNLYYIDLFLLLFLLLCRGVINSGSQSSRRSKLKFYFDLCYVSYYYYCSNNDLFER